MLEMMFALALLIIVFGLAGGAGYYFRERNDALQAGAVLKILRQAQVDYLTDHPDESPTSITADGLAPYCPGGALPALPTYRGSQPALDFNVSPPRATLNGGTFDPTDAGDNLWDAGQ